MTAVLILLQQASLLRGLGSLNQRSEWLWLPHHFSVCTTLAALSSFKHSAYLELLELPPASGVQAFCFLQLSAVLVTVAQWWGEQLLRRKQETGECQGSYLSFHHKGIFPWQWGITLPYWKTESLQCLASNPPLLIVQHSLTLTAVAQDHTITGLEETLKIIGPTHS